MSDELLIEKEPPISWLKLNRPQVLNSLNRELLRSLFSALHEIKQDSQTRIVIITATGTKAFSAGADLTERKTLSEGEVLDYLNLIQHTLMLIEELPQPVIAAINGHAFGGGTELALACDLRVMVEEATLRLTEVKLGIIPGAGGTQRLSRLIGKSKAKELILTARALTAREAYDIGLAHRIVPSQTQAGTEFYQELIAEARTWAREIATAAPLALKQAKYAIDRGFDRDLLAGLAIETKAYLELINTQDRLEGLTAFAEKRPPV
ncbi:MAG: enoyl-CoA hydratase/isomerase family protein, partial [Candidatus Melainabacteria bacterium]|nr:enoyl-CoA hydratase/isomerase family protein [Candidatus Melainabacteria bacterium]